MEEYADLDGIFLRGGGEAERPVILYEAGREQGRASTVYDGGEDRGPRQCPQKMVSTDLKKVDYEGWRLLLEAILTERIYDNIVSNLSESLQRLFHILRLCDRIYMPVLDDVASRQKLNQYENGL